MSINAIQQNGTPVNFGDKEQTTPRATAPGFVLGAVAGAATGYYGKKSPVTAKYLAGLEDDKFDKTFETVAKEKSEDVSALKEKVKTLKAAGEEGKEAATKEVETALNAIGDKLPKVKSMKNLGIGAAVGAVVLGIIGHFIGGNKIEAPAEGQAPATAAAEAPATEAAAPTPEAQAQGAETPAPAKA